MKRLRLAAAVLSLSSLGFGTWVDHEGFTDVAVIPTKGDVPTIGHGSTRYEDGSPVRMGDTITPQRAEQLARSLFNKDEAMFRASLPAVPRAPGGCFRDWRLASTPYSGLMPSNGEMIADAG